MSNTKVSNKPIEKFQLRGISASVFENVSEKGATFYKVSIVRTFKDGNEFKSNSVFSRDDLPVVELLTKKAWVTILKLESESDSKES